MKMKMKQFGLLLLTIVCTGLFVLPSTMAYFNGQHTFVAGSEVDCEKCHGDVTTELLAGTVHEHMDCQDCHITSAMSGMGMNPSDKVGHASVSVECMDCHNVDGSGMFPQAGEFGDHDITSDTAAHNDWYLEALNSDVNYGANEVCIACHSHSNIDITWTSSGANMTYVQATGEFE